jgi:hypothetical protein
MKYSDFFGFLNLDNKIIFKGGMIQPIREYGESKEWIDEYSLEDGYIYPPQVETVVLNPRTMEKESVIPKTKRPALVHKLPASHKIDIDDVNENSDQRNEDAGFIIHLLAYVYGTRLQFHDWWHDGRVPIKSTHNIFVSIETVEDFLSKSYNEWLSWGDNTRKWFLNILIMHSRAPSYEWDWERFTVEYMVFDGAYRLAKDIYGCLANNHKERFKVVFEQFGLKFDDEKINEIYTLRNELFHQALWDGGQPCTHSNAFYYQYHISRINNRAIPALLGYKNEYIGSPWWTMGTWLFDKEK